MIVNPQQGRLLRDEGIQRVLGLEQLWKDRYRAIAENWLRAVPRGYLFTGEMFRVVCVNAGLDQPHHPNAWAGASSAVIRAALKAREIAVSGRWVSAKTASRHANAMREYVKL